MQEEIGSYLDYYYYLDFIVTGSDLSYLCLNFFHK